MHYYKHNSTRLVAFCLPYWPLLVPTTINISISYWLCHNGGQNIQCSYDFATCHLVQKHQISAVSVSQKQYLIHSACDIHLLMIVKTFQIDLNKVMFAVNLNREGV